MSVYEEDIHRNNHTSVWGSYWNEGQWGYVCCHAMQYNAYCLGKVSHKESLWPVSDELFRRELKLRRLRCER